MQQLTAPLHLLLLLHISVDHVMAGCSESINTDALKTQARLLLSKAMAASNVKQQQHALAELKAFNSDAHTKLTAIDSARW